MRRFFFHLRECGTVLIDEDGAECADLADAQRCAVRAARDIMSAEVREGRLCLGCSIVVEDERGTEVAQIGFREAVQISEG